ncbi:unnamed protein product [Kluyveromyces dobzhanskii CBS 2104]|uniref:WGS project CCBQ000000000 data, contig 00102 n=1 Tax=Kluyveromyces dobzhanskii CBS 2104 TaxID=1427455 RepID=A0A0A8L4I4_9SACH|nr:unnamed protein product [Kluyveromyces dobzhanskii CBS 2104]
MSKIDEELQLLHQKIVLCVTPNSEDEIDIVLSWLSPTFQPQIPTLRIKQCLKVVFERSDERARFLIEQYYLTLIRTHFFSQFDAIVNWRDMVRLERLYLSKVEFILGAPVYWIQDEIVSFKRVLMNKNIEFKKRLHAKLEAHILDNDLDRFNQLYQWLAPAFDGQEIEFNAKMINLKVDQLSQELMKNNVDDRYLVMNTYNHFIKDFWSKFYKSLITEDDHELTAIIYQSFEKNYTKYKCDEFYTKIVPQFPASRKCLLELRSILNKDIKTVGAKVLENLYHGFVSRFLTSSLLTCEILYFYIKTVKCLKIIDPMGMCLRSLSKAVRKYLNSRPDLITTLVLGIFPLHHDERIKVACVSDGNSIHFQKLEQFAKEVGDFSLGPELPTALPWFHQPHLPRCTYDGNDELLKQYLNWVPEPPRIRLDVEEPEDNDVKYVPPADLIHVLLDTLESKRALVDDLLSVVSGKFIESEEYTLDSEWQKIMNILLNHLEATRKGAVTSEEDDLTHLNDVDIMLEDLKLSSRFRNQVAHKNNAYIGSFPHVKILSKLYWRHYQSLNGRLITSKRKWNDEMKPLVDNLTSIYEVLNVGRTLKFDTGSSSRVSFNMILNSGETKSFKVTMEQYLVISHFQSEANGEVGQERHGMTTMGNHSLPDRHHTLTSLHHLTSIPKTKLLTILSFWKQKGVVLEHPEGYFGIKDET